MAVQLRADIGLSLDSVGLVFASYFGAAALLSIPFRHAAERIGLRASLRIGLAIYAAALARDGRAGVVDASDVRPCGTGGCRHRGDAHRVECADRLALRTVPSGPGLRSQTRLDPGCVRDRRAVGARACADCRLALGVRDRGRDGVGRRGDGAAVESAAGPRRDAGTAEPVAGAVDRGGSEFRARRGSGGARLAPTASARRWRRG